MAAVATSCDSSANQNVSKHKQRMACAKTKASRSGVCFISCLLIYLFVYLFIYLFRDV